MKNIGLLASKNDEIIVKEVLSKNINFVDAIYVIDGSSDKTPEIIKKFPKVKEIIYEKDLPTPPNGFKDNVRQYALDSIIKNEGYGCWVTLLHTDEVFYHNPRKVIDFAEKEKADAVFWRPMHFFLHTYDKDKWETIKNYPLQERITWYATTKKIRTEFRQFKLTKNKKFPQKHNPTVMGITKRFSKIPLYKHYKAHTPNYLLSENDRWGFEHNAIFTDKLKAIGKFDFDYNIKFNGNFGQFEKEMEYLK